MQKLFRSFEMEIHKLCRSCMKQLEIWENYINDDGAWDMFSFCTKIKVNDDTMPKHFCNECIARITSAYSFIQDALKIDIILKNLVSRKTSVIIEPEKPSKNNITPLQIIEDDVNDNSVFDVPKNDDVGPEIENFEFTPKQFTIEANNKKVCVICSKKFTSTAWFNKHMEKEHTVTEYPCKACPKIFRKRCQLSAHEVTHSEERKFSCASCSKSYKLRKQLTMHLRVHSDDRPFECNICSMRFKIKSVLKCHINLHNNEKNYLCSYCGRSFADGNNLKVHLRTHTGEKPYACGACTFRAASASSVRRHERRHARASHLACGHCDKRFYDSTALRRHTRTHTGERPFRCPWCARRFADQWKRKRHAVRAHSLRLHEIPRMDAMGRPIDTA